jgi:hypothetical protein
LHSLPLPFGHSARERARAASHHSDLSQWRWTARVWKLGFSE